MRKGIIRYEFARVSFLCESHPRAEYRNAFPTYVSDKIQDTYMPRKVDMYAYNCVFLYFR